MPLGLRHNRGMNNNVTFLKSSPTQWMSRCNRYTITHEAKGRYVLRDGWGATIQTAKSLRAAKGAAA